MLNILHKDAAVLSIADAAGKGATAIIAILIARFFGPELYGQYATASAIAGLMMMFAGVGFEREFTRMGSANPATRPYAFRLTLFSLLAACMVAYFALTGLLLVATYSAETKAITFLLGIVLILARFTQPFRYLFIIIGKIKVIAGAQVLSTGFLMVLVLTAIVLDVSMITIVCLQVLTGGFLFFGLWKSLPVKFHSLARPNASELYAFVKRSIPFAVSNMVWVAYFNFDTFILSAFHNEQTVGNYASAFRVVSVSFIFGAALTHAFSPTLFFNFSGNFNNYRAVAQNIIVTQLIGGVALALVFWFAAEMIIAVILGDDYFRSIVLIKGLSVVVLLRFVNFGLSELLTTSNQQRTRMALELSLIAVNIALNLALVPEFKGVGAVISSIVAETVLLGGSIYFCSRSGLLFGNRRSRE